MLPVRPIEAVPDLAADPGTEAVVDSAAEAPDAPPACATRECGEDGDCVTDNPCVESGACEEGCCAWTFRAKDTPCEVGCMVGGKCSPAGDCQGLSPIDCPDADANGCTRPWCDPATGQCATGEIPLDGPAPFASYCHTGLLCTRGALDLSAALPTALFDKCAAEDAALSPWGCTVKVLCMDAESDCVVVSREDGVQCWTGGPAAGPAFVCEGHQCSGGACVPVPAFAKSCGESDWPAGCDAGCRACTELMCYWVPDAEGKARVPYCATAARTGEACDDANQCTENAACAVLSEVTGPIGPESLGTCPVGRGKSTAECLSELGKPDLPCLRAGVTCSGGGCGFDADAADKWCTPAASVCHDPEGTYCVGADTGDGKWDAATGCRRGGSFKACGPNETCVAGTCTSSCSPVDGGWGEWSFGACSVACGGGKQSGTRSCDSPAPSCGGLACAGPAETTEDCNTAACTTTTCGTMAPWRQCSVAEYVSGIHGDSKNGAEGCAKSCGEKAALCAKFIWYSDDPEAGAVCVCHAAPGIEASTSPFDQNNSFGWKIWAAECN
jgi:hypothetical protein